MARPRTPPEHKRLLNRLAQRRHRARSPLTPEQKAEKKARNKARQQTPKYKAWAAAKYRARREALATRPRPDSCEVCGQPPNGMGALHLDHCHTTKAFRGWLCQSCNIILGNASDDPVLLRKLADYLDRFPRGDEPYQKQRSWPRPEKTEKPLPLLDEL